ncbi:hypothetical protein GGTG_06111 [Gaeumannomyces tritici R3-111a-1]|uniref:Uncharacterized protein n=1 Tax=Gaeumannomyces tritici (strain R3-111a-1) TaxID=644352 RepID=J3NXV6_GAET3|nr:hypothetical protein GGTG_06111 [Gaeumannomyces tritici R3-111a-1]EJT76189.1 hypothetical protein GGTG_06111 [Gaeumannomyces tritici R3-111a-1]
MLPTPLGSDLGNRQAGKTEPTARKRDREIGGISCMEATSCSNTDAKAENAPTQQPTTPCSSWGLLRLRHNSRGSIEHSSALPGRVLQSIRGHLLPTAIDDTGAQSISVSGAIKQNSPQNLPSSRSLRNPRGGGGGGGGGGEEEEEDDDVVGGSPVGFPN